MNDLTIKKKILTIRGKQVMLDRDLANLYEVDTGNLNKAVNRNIKRFPESFMFKLNKQELKNWRYQFVTSNSDKMGLRYSPYAFTEQGVSMLSALLKNDKAIETSIKIINAFVAMRKFLTENANFFQKFQQINYL